MKLEIEWTENLGAKVGLDEISGVKFKRGN